MAAPKGNQFWKLIKAEDIGRNMRFETPQMLWEGAQSYFKECDEMPIERKEKTSTDKGVFDKVYIHSIPYTWEGLYIFLGVCNLNHYKEKEAFSTIITHIGNIIRNQKFTGASIGIFNANIIARDLGLRDSSDITTDGEKIQQVTIVRLPDNNRDKKE